MTHHDEGKYAAKHPPGSKPDDKVALAVKDALKEGKLSCAAASRISKDLGVSMEEIGRTADLLEVRINKCIYGLFGRTDKSGNKMPVKPAATVSDKMRKAIDERLDDGRLSCADGWEIADTLGAPRKSIAGICETLKVKINKCQLGAF
jgi:hypothetical protein